MRENRHELQCKKTMKEETKINFSFALYFIIAPSIHTYLSYFYNADNQVLTMRSDIL